MRVATAATVCFPMAICVYYVEVAAAVVVAFAICFATDTRYNIQDTNMWGGEWEWEYWCLVLVLVVGVPGQIMNMERRVAGVSPARFPWPMFEP